MFDARSLHAWLGNSYAFSHWFRDRLRQYGFVESADYVCLKSFSGKGRGGHNRRDYLITRDMAKELAMVERTDIGRETRRYFIQMEQAAATDLELSEIGSTLIGGRRGH